MKKEGKGLSGYRGRRNNAIIAVEMLFVDAPVEARLQEMDRDGLENEKATECIKALQTNGTRCIQRASLKTSRAF